jgi:hypothetical protein
MCSHSGLCYDKPTGGANCDDGKGPTRNVCSSDCTACGDYLDSSAPTTTPAPTIEVVNYWSKTCDTKPEKPCMPHWCEVSDIATCSLESLPVEEDAELLLLNDLENL